MVTLPLRFAFELEELLIVKDLSEVWLGKTVPKGIDIGVIVAWILEGAVGVVFLQVKENTTFRKMMMNIKFLVI